MVLMEDITKILFALLIGGLIGAEREFRDKAAGFRTIIFITEGATLFTILSVRIGAGYEPVRIAANIVSGVGFLGAGAILRGSERIAGLTTASTIWLAAALGMGIGGGYFFLVGISTILILIVLWAFPRIELWIAHFRSIRSYSVIFGNEPEAFQTIEQIFLGSGLHVMERKRVKEGQDAICTWHVYGRPKQHEQLIDQLLASSQVKEFHF